MSLLDSSIPYSKHVLRITEIIFLAITKQTCTGYHKTHRNSPPVLQFMTHEYNKQGPIGTIKETLYTMYVFS